MTDSSDLLPCPFCGGTTINTVNDDLYDWYQCTWCHALGPFEMPDNSPPQGWNIREPQAVAVEVKPLVWEEVVQNEEVVGFETEDYYIDLTGDQFELIHDNHTHGLFDSPDAAKAAADEHHRNMILSHITTRSVDDVLEQAAQVADKSHGGNIAGSTETTYAATNRDAAKAIRALKSQPAPAPVQDEAVQIPDDLIDALRSQRQLDADGCMVGVSRQAVDQAIEIITALAAMEGR